MKRSPVYFLLFFGLAWLPASAQRVSATVNLSQFDLDQVSSGGNQIDYRGSTSLSANLRLFNKRHWALRVGAGLDNLNYTVGDGINTDYSARRQDLKGMLGLEKHFIIANTLDLYPGIYVPLIVVGDDVIDAVDQNLENIDNGGLRSGLGVVLGANVKLLKFMRLGLEFDAGYDNFREGIWDGVQQRSFVPVRGIHHTTALTLGVAF